MLGRKGTTKIKMKAFRNVAGNVVEITVDVGLDGKPILPPDTTVDPRPEPNPGHYVTVVGREWVQIEIPVVIESFESKVARKLEAIGKYRDWLTEQPVEVGGVKFDADEQARSRLTQALVIQSTLGYLPPAWISYDNTPQPLTTVDDLKAIVQTVQTAFATRFFECDVLRQAAKAATNTEELDLVVVPSFGDFI